VALIPALGYSVAYAFAVGRAIDLGMPSQLISVSLPDVFRSFGAVIAPLVFVYFLFNTVSHHFVSTLMNRLRALRVMICLELGSAVFLKAAQANWHLWALVLGIETVVLPIDFIIALFSARKTDGTYREKLARVAATPQAPRVSLMDSIFGRLGITTFLTFTTVALVLLLSFYSGWGSASNQQTFFEESGTNNALIAMDGSNYVFETHAGHQLTGRFIVIPSSRTIHMTALKIGPLRTPKVCDHTTC
jgi:hypothetical protein